MLYAVTEIAAFMVGATIVGFLLGRITKRSAPKIVAGKDTAELATAQAAVRELESERASLRGQLADAKERSRQLAAETTAAEVSEDFAEEKRRMETALEEASAQADRLRATIAERDSRIAALAAGEAPQDPTEHSGTVGYSSSAGTFTDTRIVFGDEEEA
jgi:predicted RNase H-like nuclease (RuvC/YqgF family)